MLELPKNAPGEAACGYSGRPLVAVCPCGGRRSIPFRKLKTDFGDKTPIYGRPFQCKECKSSEVTLFVFDDPAEFYRLWDDLRDHRSHYDRILRLTRMLGRQTAGSSASAAPVLALGRPPTSPPRRS